MRDTLIFGGVNLNPLPSLVKVIFHGTYFFLLSQSSSSYEIVLSSKKPSTKYVKHPFGKWNTAILAYVHGVGVSTSKKKKRANYNLPMIWPKFKLPTCGLKLDTLPTLRLRLRVHKGREGNGMIIIEWKGMESNGMYLSKGKEWNGMELSNLDWMF